MNYKKIKDYKNLTQIFNFAKLHYRKFNREEKAQIFNQVIQDRLMKAEHYNFSLRLAVELSSIFMVYKTNIISKFIRGRFNLDKEKEIFIHIINKIFELDTFNKEFKDLKRYMNYKYDYPSIHAYEYYNLFKYFDDLSNEIYGLSIKENFYILLLFVASPDNLYIKTRNYKVFDNLFIKSNDNSEKIFIEDRFRNYFKGKLGLKFSDGLYVPRTHYIFENILRGILENDKSKDIKGDILELYSKEIISNYFDEIYQTLYDNKGNEQDLIIKYKDIILFIECKSQNFKSIFINGKDAYSIIEKHFEEVIVKACKQCQRGKEYLLEKDNVIYYPKLQ